MFDVLKEDIEGLPPPPNKAKAVFMHLQSARRPPAACEGKSVNKSEIYVRITINHTQRRENSEKY